MEKYRKMQNGKFCKKEICRRIWTNQSTVPGSYMRYSKRKTILLPKKSTKKRDERTAKYRSKSSVNIYMSKQLNEYVHFNEISDCIKISEKDSNIRTVKSCLILFLESVLLSQFSTLVLFLIRILVLRSLQVRDVKYNYTCILIES